MSQGQQSLRLVVQAALKLDARTPAWKNVVSMILSCYGCLVRDYDFDEALLALGKLTPEEQAALIGWVLLVEESRRKGGAKT